MTEINITTVTSSPGGTGCSSIAFAYAKAMLDGAFSTENASTNGAVALIDVSGKLSKLLSGVSGDSRLALNRVDNDFEAFQKTATIVHGGLSVFSPGVGSPIRDTETVLRLAANYDQVVVDASGMLDSAEIIPLAQMSNRTVVVVGNPNDSISTFQQNATDEAVGVLAERVGITSELISERFRVVRNFSDGTEEEQRTLAISCSSLRPAGHVPFSANVAECASQSELARMTDFQFLAAVLRTLNSTLVNDAYAGNNIYDTGTPQKTGFFSRLFRGSK